MRTRDEKRRRLSTFIVIVLLAVGLGGFIALDPNLQDAILTFILTVVRIRAVQVTAGALLIVIFVISEVLDNADKLHFLLEMIYKLLGYDSKEIASRDREFTEIPDTYVKRPQLEDELSEAMRNGARPKLIILYGERDTGKTTLLHFVVPRGLSKRYRGRVVSCSADRRAVEAGPDENDEQIRLRLARKVFKRIIDESNVPGDIGEGTAAMSAAIAKHFLREEQPWLLIIDQLDDAFFPFEIVVPALLGARNTVVIACRNRNLGEQILLTHKAPDAIKLIEVPMQPFTEHQAMTLLKYELDKRRKRFSRAMLRALQPHLANATPGVIQRLVDLYQDDRSPELIENAEQALDDTSGVQSELRIRKIAKLIIGQFNPDEERLVAALALFEGGTVGKEVLRHVARRPRATANATASDDLDVDALIRGCVARGYLRPSPVPAPKGLPSRYAITKLGMGISRTTRNAAPPAVELQVGAAILNYYRNAVVSSSQFDRLDEFSNIMGILAWSQVAPRTLPESDVLTFTRLMKDAFYAVGRWGLGVQWLSLGIENARSKDYPCCRGDLLAARAVLRLAHGNPRQAIADLKEASVEFARSQQQVDADLLLSTADAPLLRRSSVYDRLQLLWVRHLDVMAQLASVTIATGESTLQAIIERIRETRSRLQGLEVDARTDYAEMVRQIRLALAMNNTLAGILVGDALARRKQRAAARAIWRQAWLSAKSVHRDATAAGSVDRELLAQAWRAMGALCHRRASFSGPLARPMYRRQGIGCLRRSLRWAGQLPARYEEALTLHEIARLAMAGSRQPRLPDERAALRRRPNALRSLVARCLPRWHRLRGAVAQLRVANAAAASLRASATQVSTQVTLAHLSLRLWRLEHDPKRIAEARDYAEGARTIAYRLQQATPEVADEIASLPTWLLSPQAQPIKENAVLTSIGA